MKEILDVIQNRRTIRKYKDTEPDSVLLSNILGAANMAPSNGNAQPWEFIVARGEYCTVICEEFYHSAKTHIPTATYIPDDQKTIMLKYAKNFGGAPCHIVVTYPNLESESKRENALKGACAAIQNLLLQAHANGLGTVWIGGNVNQSEKIKKALSITDDKLIAAIIPIGYPEVIPAAPARLDIETKTTWLGF